jgi:hypothetical protein
MKYQYSLELIQHEVSGTFIQQRSLDGYINASQLCNAAGRPWHQYISQETNGHFVRALCESLDMTRGELVLEIPTGETVDYWVHPQLAIHLAQWLSAKFAVKVSEWVFNWTSGLKSPFGKPSTMVPYHIERYMLNASQVPAGYFSVLQEMTFILIAPLESHGYVLPESMVPDISMGRFLCKKLRDKLGVDTDALPVYTHKFPDGREVEAKIYPEEYLPIFRQMIRDEWLPVHASEYFAKRDSAALPYLDKILLLPSPKAAKSKFSKSLPRPSL